MWVAWVIGLGSVPVDGILFVVAIIAASGAAIGTQVSAAIVFVAGSIAVIEIILVGYLATPAKTKAVLRRLHDWLRAHHRQVLIAMFAVVRVSQLAQGWAASELGLRVRLRYAAARSVLKVARWST